jgi:AraC-like DNA-binding protein
MSEYGLRDEECIWVDRIPLPEGGRFGEHHHPRLQIVWAEHGQLEVVAADRHWVLPPSHAVWIPGGSAHDVHGIPGTEVYCVYLWDEEVETAFSTMTVLSMSPLARALVRHLAREDLLDVDARHARATLLSVLEPARTGSVDLPMPHDPRALRVARAVLAEPDRPHEISAWATQLHTGERTLRRAFLEDTALTYSQWRTHARLLSSLPLLSQGIPVDAVAARCGYASPNGFAGAFRRHFGVTPGAYFR